MVTMSSAVAKKDYDKRAALALAAVGGIGLVTIAEDVLTAGAGIADDIPSLIGALGSAAEILAR